MQQCNVKQKPVGPYIVLIGKLGLISVDKQATQLVNPPNSATPYDKSNYLPT